MLEQTYLCTQTWAAVCIKLMLFIASHTHYSALPHFDRVDAQLGSYPVSVRSYWRLSGFSWCSSLPLHVTPFPLQESADAVFALTVLNSVHKFMCKAILAPICMPWIWKKNAAPDQYFRLYDWEMFGYLVRTNYSSYLLLYTSAGRKCTHFFPAKFINGSQFQTGCRLLQFETAHWRQLGLWRTL